MPLIDYVKVEPAGLNFKGTGMYLSSTPGMLPRDLHS